MSDLTAKEASALHAHRRATEEPFVAYKFRRKYKQKGGNVFDPGMRADPADFTDNTFADLLRRRVVVEAADQPFYESADGTAEVIDPALDELRSALHFGVDYDEVIGWDDARRRHLVALAVADVADWTEGDHRRVANRRVARPPGGAT